MMEDGIRSLGKKMSQSTKKETLIKMNTYSKTHFIEV